MDLAFSIARFVEDARISVLRDHDEPFAIDWLPNGRTSIVIRVPDEGPGDAYVIGPRTRAKLKRATGFQRAAAIQFKPGWVPSLFGVPASELTDQLVPLEELWGPASRDVTSELVAASSIPVMLERLSRAIAGHATFEASSAHLARRAIRLFQTSETRVEAVAKQLGVSARHLRRAFLDSVGIGPKQFARGVRLQRAIAETAQTSDWGVIAHNAGYYDQAHMIGDFRELVGLTPNAYLAQRSPQRTPQYRASG